MTVWLHLLTSTPYGNKWPHARPGHFTPGVRFSGTPEPVWTFRKK